MEIELAVYNSKRNTKEIEAIEEEREGDEDNLLDSVKDMLLPGNAKNNYDIHNSNNNNIIQPHHYEHHMEEGQINEFISKAQQKRLKRLFDASDKQKKGYLTRHEFNYLFRKLESVMPGSDLVQFAHGEGLEEEMTFNEFLSFFASVKSSHRKSLKLGNDNIPERIGTYMLKTFSKRHAVKKVSSSVTAHPLDSAEYDYEEYSDRNRIILFSSRDHRSLVWTKAGAIFRASLIGAFFAAIAGFAEYLIGKKVHYTGEITGIPPEVTWEAILIFWGVVIAVNVAVTILEILCLYLDSLRAAAHISGYLGLDPWLVGYVNDMDHAASAIVRAAFELPHPSKQILGIQPLKYTNKLNGFLRALLWKSKRGLTALLIGLFLRRLIPRASMKVASPFIAVPIAMLWNSLVAWKGICSIYAIVIGNIAISRVVSQVIAPRWDQLTESARRLMYCVAGVGIVLEQEIHPTLETLLRILCRYWGDPPPGLLIDDKFFFQNQIIQHHREEQLLILQLLAVAIVSNSHIPVTSMVYLKTVVSACNLNPDEQGLDELRNQLSSKSYIDVEHITDLFRDSLTTDHSRTLWGKVKLTARVLSYNLAY